MICAPFSTCCLATDTASSYFSLRIKLEKAFEPVTLVLSPTLMNSESSLITKGSKPDNCVYICWEGIILGFKPFISFAMAAICAGVVPQQPPAIFTNPLSANSFRSEDVSSGLSSKPVSDIGFGNPAFG